MSLLCTPFCRAAGAACILLAVQMTTGVSGAQSALGDVATIFEPGGALPVKAELELPESPGSVFRSAAYSSILRGAGGFEPASGGSGGWDDKVIPKAAEVLVSRKEIEPWELAPSLTVRNKIALGVRSAISPFAAVGWLASAGYAHITNGSPNYGTDRGAFGERLGAAAIRDASDDVIGDSILSPIFREDPRYYRMGPLRNVFLRTIYAATRPLITRTDGGRQTPNLSRLAGTLAGSAWTNGYYPDVNRGPGETMKTFGGSLAGSAVGDFVSEFSGDLLEFFHLTH